MATVELRFAPMPEHVRTARLVATALARRAGVDESLLDEVRLAVGEACTRAVGLHRAYHPDAPVTVSLDDGENRFSVRVTDVVTAADVGVAEDIGSAPDHAHDAGAHLEPWGDAGADMGLAVISGLVDDLDVGAGDKGGVISMSWPAGHGTPTAVGARVTGDQQVAG